MAVNRQLLRSCFLAKLNYKNLGDEPERWIQASSAGFPSKSELAPERFHAENAVKSR